MKQSKNDASADSNRNPPADFRSLSHTILRCATAGTSKADFLRQVSMILIEFWKCDAVELRVNEEGPCFLCQATRNPSGAVHLEIKSGTRHEESAPPAASEPSAVAVGHDNSCAILPLSVANEPVGLLRLTKNSHGRFTSTQLKHLEEVARALAVAVITRRSQAALRERVKELTCLYGIAQIAEQPDTSLEEVLRGIVNLLPPAWQYPEIAQARIVLDEHCYSTSSFCESARKQSAEIVVANKHRGFVEVTYTETRPCLDEGPFLKEERNLIDAVAKQVAFIIERRQAAEERAQLQQQLMHADRLATIGQLAAGVAHELNEPLGNVLGFAQLAAKCAQLPDQTRDDLAKIERAALHARDIIRKLLLFARHMPSNRAPTNLNHVIEEALYFLEARCAGAGIELERMLAPDLPLIVADPALLNQVLVNLVVNAIQAMPDGGMIRVATRRSEREVLITVEDTGRGIDDKTMKQIFLPFFTTKDVGQGTGLGLSVAHGIIASHGGSIDVRSKVGRGTRFTVHLPIATGTQADENN